MQGRKINEDLKDTPWSLLTLVFKKVNMTQEKIISPPPTSEFGFGLITNYYNSHIIAHNFSSSFI